MLMKLTENSQPRLQHCQLRLHPVCKLLVSVGAAYEITTTLSKHQSSASAHDQISNSLVTDCHYDCKSH